MLPFVCSLFYLPCSLFPVPCSLFPVPCSLKPIIMYFILLKKLEFINTLDSSPTVHLPGDTPLLVP
ncbi:MULTISPECIES: hypothetical protein [unclassified Moorena]|uniref:hypothetical protein n=1 Tax=unclassified Moorena TaxID=2683338 RepID=UPI0014014A20|nr:MULTISPECIES: hypothetical protein [unclassified Moorena]NEO15085.1 hypothetical protein [Moorena sp. SIO3E8]NEQ01673.1 hypothetical protein [Moorena sp. SIO3F7]